ncbi:type IV toxin-antitoxin system AbiEi family antitoxin [Achromobacter kerstersii]|nr:type IV toxin-antitoxin system AbiEi family antitoxin [Achromobacter kerstersii]
MRAGYPRDIPSAVAHIQDFQRAQPNASSVAGVVVADSLSPGARSDLRQRGIGYFDHSGTLFFKHQPWLVDIERAAPSRPRRPAALFTGAREQVVLALLQHAARHQSDGFISGAELASLAGTSPYTVSLTMQALQREDWVETMGNGPRLRRRLRDANALLDAWAQAWTLRRDTTSRYFLFSPPRTSLRDTLLHTLRQKEHWALTGAAAANAAFPHLTQVERVEVIVPPGQAQAWGREMGLEPAEKGANVLFIEREGASMMFLDDESGQTGANVANRFIQYLDLLNGYGRNKELAQEFRRHVLHLEPEH